MEHTKLKNTTPGQTSHSPETDEQIQKLRDQLRDIYTSWQEDQSVPPNYLRRDGLGRVVAEVNVWCGGFQRPSCPAIIGWRAQVSNRLNEGYVLTNNRDTKDCIKEAKKLADEGLQDLWDDGSRNSGSQGSR